MSVKYFFLRLVSYREKKKSLTDIYSVKHPLSMFLERIMPDGLEEHDEKVSIGGRNITWLRFADGIGALAGEEEELEDLVESLDKNCTRYKMDIGAERVNLMTNSVNGIQREINIKGQKPGTATSFRYLGAVSGGGFKPAILKLKPFWRDNNISLGSKVKRMAPLSFPYF